MTQRFVEGFATYGLGVNFSVTSKTAQAMLAGRWASLNGVVNYTIGQLPWAPEDTDLFLSSPPLNPGNQGARVILPATGLTTIVSLYFAVNVLPYSTPVVIASFCDGANNIIAGIMVGTTGAIEAFVSNTYDGTQVFASSSGPALTAQSAAHVECSLTVNSGLQLTLTCQVNGTAVISGAVFTSTSVMSHFGGTAQMRFLDAYPAAGADIGLQAYIGNLIVRDSAGSYNNGIVGDRRVFTAFPDADDLAHQGWTGQPLHRFGNGILDNTASGGVNSAVTAAAAANTDIGSQQFTIEGQFRFQTLPTGSNKAVLFAKWDQPNNHESYELYVGGPSLEAGNIVFRISTDGTPSTAAELISWAYQWQVGVWYHVAVTRDGSNNLRLFINGILQGVAVSDSHNYYSGGSSGALCCLGGEFAQGTGIVNGTSFAGWQDEFRLTIGQGRYTANFSPPVAAFPRGGGDAYWADVVWVSGWDSASLVDESSFARALTSQNGAVAITPNDGTYNYQTINKEPAPNDNTFIEAALLSASQLLTYGALPTLAATVRVGTKDGTAAAVYTWVSTLTGAFQVLKDVSVAASMSNLAAAINAGAGAGSVYGTGTTANYDVSANVLSSGQLQAVALTPGSVGNSIACTSTDSNGAWGAATLTGGQNIPAYSQFYFQRLPSNTTLVDSITLLSRSWKTDSGSCQTQVSLVGGSGGVETGANNSVTTAPSFYVDTFETDPDTSGPVTPTTVLLARARVNRTA
jgi:hypothetical protein